MKKRNGFVSNSSSSSFLLVTTQENWERVKPQLTPLQLVIAENFQRDNLEVLGRTMVTFSTYEDGGGALSVDQLVDNEDLPGIDYDEDDPHDVVFRTWPDIVKKVIEIGGEEAAKIDIYY